MSEKIPFLTGKMLVAMPGMGDPRFERSVIFLCVHNRDGAMGLIVNKPAPDLRFADLLEQLDIKAGRDMARTEVYFGGPVEHGRGFVLHTPDYMVDGATLAVGEDFAMTATLDILREISTGAGPAKALLSLGYAGWGEGQLEREIRANGWLTCDASPELVFETRAALKWDKALAEMGIDPKLLSAEGGRA